MTKTEQEGAGRRLGGVAATALLHVLLGAALLWGLGVPVPRVVQDPLAVFDVAPPPLPPEPVVTPPPPRVESEEIAERFSPGEEGAASPPNIRSQATQIVAPEPVVLLPLPPPIVAAPVAGIGNDPSQGAADVRGPGTGSGGLGDGTGSGAGGGGGGGGGYGRERPPIQTRGRITMSDYPIAAQDAGFSGVVSVLYTIPVDGRAVDCRVTRSSGRGDVDAATCRLIEQRFRFRPSRDENGRPVVSHIEQDHYWELEIEPSEPPRRR